MHRLTQLPAMLLFFAALLIAASLSCQNNKKASPAATATGKVGQANLTNTYSSPAVKGRKIRGGLVPYNSVWRAGADEATTFTTDR